MSRLVLIDGNAILHRAYHALPLSLTNRKGEPTNAVYGFVSMLLRVIEDLQPSHIAVTFDRPKPTFRKEIFKDYQAQRPEMEEALASQIGKVHTVAQAMQISIYEMDGYEADDVIGTLARQAQATKYIAEVVVVTGDRDLLQLVKKNVKLYMPVKGLTEAKLYGIKETKERMGVNPQQIPDFKALAGDASDNYPGVAGIGPKTAISLLSQFGSVANIYKNIKKIKNPALSSKLVHDKKNAFLSHELATIVTTVPVKLDTEKTKLTKDLLTQEVIEEFGNLGFKTLLKRLSKMTQRTKPAAISKEASSDTSQMELF